MSDITTITPVLSRRTVNPLLAARGMRSAAELAAGKPCGTRVRYYAGCRCDACRRANTDYELARAAARARGEGNGLVSAERARKHLAWLSKRGVGRKTAADAAKVAPSIVSRIADGSKTKIREQTERRILAVTETTAADGARVSARATWRMLDELITAGYSKARIASEVLGRPVRSLQISRSLVEVRTAAMVLAAYERLRYANEAGQRSSLARLSELREEGYRSDEVLRRMTTLAERLGWRAPTLGDSDRNGLGRLRQEEKNLLQRVHAELLAEVPS
jgi:hypothetical protein